MTSLELASLLSILVCIIITVFSATRGDSGSGQSVKDSMVEAWTNVVIGFSINYLANLVILPMVPSLGFSHIDPWENFLMGWLYTAISMIRSFSIRRWHNHLSIKKQLQVSQA